MHCIGCGGKIRGRSPIRIVLHHPVLPEIYRYGMVVHAHSLKDYVRDDFIPKPKVPPVRATEEVILPCEEDVCPFCGAPLVYWYLSTERTIITIPYDVKLQVVHSQEVRE